MSVRGAGRVCGCYECGVGVWAVVGCECCCGCDERARAQQQHAVHGCVNACRGGEW